MRKFLLVASISGIVGFLTGFIPQKRHFIKLSEAHKADLIRLNNLYVKLDEMKKENEELKDSIRMDEIIYGRVRY